MKSTRWTAGWNCCFLLVVSLVAHQARGHCYPAIFNFGDNEGDTGGMHASFPQSTPADFPPYGETYFGYETGRNSDGRLIIDFIAQTFGLNLLDPYLQSVTSDFSTGVNFAAWGAVARAMVNYLSPFPLPTQVNQFKLFQTEVLEVLNGTSSILASKGLMSSLNESTTMHPYKKLFNDLFNTAIPSPDSGVKIALEAAARLPLADYFAQGLYIISIGTNDFRMGISTNMAPSQIGAYLPNVSLAITTAVQDLYNAGARNIIVSGVGPLGCSPSVLAIIVHTKLDLDNWGCLIQWNTLVREYNALLQQDLTNIIPQLPAASVSFLDLYQIQHNLLFNYSQNGFVQVLTACCGVPSTYNYDPQVLCGQRGSIANDLSVSQTCLAPNTYAGWDGMHYTEAANQYFVEQIFSGQFFTPPFSLPLQACAPI